MKASPVFKRIKLGRISFLVLHSKLELSCKLRKFSSFRKIVFVIPILKIYISLSKIRWILIIIRFVYTYWKNIKLFTVSFTKIMLLPARRCRWNPSISWGYKFLMPASKISSISSFDGQQCYKILIYKIWTTLERVYQSKISNGKQGNWGDFKGLFSISA